VLNQHRVDVLFDTIVRVIAAARVVRSAAPQVAASAFVLACGVVHFSLVSESLDAGVRDVAEAAEVEAAGADSAPSVVSTIAATTASLFHPVARPAPRTAAVRPAAISAEQRNIARFIADKYRLAFEQTQEFVEHAYRTAKELKLDPWLILAVISVESSFDPTAESNRGAKGLMQVLTRVHADKFAPFGGVAAAFDPLANMRVGAQILKEYMARDGTVETALKSYVGAALLPHDNGYGAKVLSERERIAAVAAGLGPQAVEAAVRTRKPAPAVVEPVAAPVVMPVATPVVQHSETELRIKHRFDVPAASAPEPARADEEASLRTDDAQRPG